MFLRGPSIRRMGSNAPKVNIFDRLTKLRQRECAAFSPDVENYDFLKEEIGFRVADRVLDIKRKMNTLVDIGSGRGYVPRHISCHSFDKVIATEMSPTYLEQMSPPEDEEVAFEKIILDEDGAKLPFEDESICGVTSSLSLHWVNDLPGLFSEVMRVLKKDGVFLGSMFGGDTLYEMRSSFQLAEMERDGGFGVHVSPFIEISDLGGLLNRAGFTMLTLDADELPIKYASLFALMKDLKGMGENNATWNRSHSLKRDNIFAANAIYKSLYANEDADKSIPATFQIYYWIAWKPDPSQSKPLKPQKPDVSLKDLENLDEILKDKKEF